MAPKKMTEKVRPYRTGLPFKLIRGTGAARLFHGALVALYPTAEAAKSDRGATMFFGVPLGFEQD